MVSSWPYFGEWGIHWCVLGLSGVSWDSLLCHSAYLNMGQKRFPEQDPGKHLHCSLSGDKASSNIIIQS